MKSQSRIYENQSAAACLYGWLFGQMKDRLAILDRFGGWIFFGLREPGGDGFIRTEARRGCSITCMYC